MDKGREREREKKNTAGLCWAVLEKVFLYWTSGGSVLLFFGIYTNIRFGLLNASHGFCCFTLHSFSLPFRFIFFQRLWVWLGGK